MFEAHFSYRWQRKIIELQEPFPSFVLYARAKAIKIESGDRKKDGGGGTNNVHKLVEEEVIYNLSQPIST